MKKSFLAALSAFLLPAAMLADDRDAQIRINDNVTYQHVTGFGGFSPSPTWSYWLGNADMDKLFGKGDNQLGLNILRLYMANSKNAWSSGVANAKRAKSHGAFIFASPWSPPASWKSNNSDSNGGELLAAHYADWANFLNDYYKYMKQQGVTIDAVSLQNEPDWKASYQSCIWTGEQMRDFLKEYGSLIECKVIAPEAIHFTRSMHEPILKDADACARLDILGGHFYGWDGSSYPLAAQKGKEVWMTEYLINERQQNEGKDIDWETDGFLFAKSVNDAMLANFSAWVHYSLKRYYGCIGDGTYGTVDGQITKRGYILSHFAKYVSGTTRVKHSLIDDSGKLSVSAYETATGDSIVVMVLNPTADTYNLDFTLPFNTLGGRMIITTEYDDMVKEDLSYDVESNTPAAYIDPYSVNTLVFEKSSERSGDDDVTDQGEIVYTDDFDLSGASCVPEGWRTKWEEGTRYAGDYSLGPRIMSFSPEGEMAYAFYFRSAAGNAGNIVYGQESNMRLPLEPGKYTISYSTVGWKGIPEINFEVKMIRGKAVLTEAVTPEYLMSANGASERIVHTTDSSTDFDVTVSGDYTLKWEMSASSGGYKEALVGNIRLVKHNPTGIDDVIMDTTADDSYYDIYGRRIMSPASPGIYIHRGRKVMIRP